MTQSDCHSEPAFFAPPGIWAATRAKCDTILARLSRLLINSRSPALPIP
jgi:hypothetical protein